MEVFARILSRLEEPLLQHHCSAVLDEELRHVHAAFQEVSAAYERLQEVREAVASLEAGSVDAHRSDSVMETVDATAQLQHELTQRMQFVERALRSHAVVSKFESLKTTTVSPTRKRHKEDIGEDAVPEDETEDKPYKHTKVSDVIISKAPSSTDDLDSGSETESENETVPTDPESSESAVPLTSVALWEDHVHGTGKIAQRLFSAKMAPALNELTQLVDALAQVLAQIPADIGDLRAAAKGQFNNLVVLTVRVFRSGQRNQSFVPLAERTLQALQNAMARGTALQGLRKFYDELQEIKQRMEQYEITTSYTDPRASEHTPTPSGTKILAMWDLAQAMLSGTGRPKVAEVTSLVASLHSVLVNVEIEPGVSIRRLGNCDLEQLLRRMVRVFAAIRKDRTYPLAAQMEFLQAAQKVVQSLEGEASRDPELKYLQTYHDRFSAVVRKMQARIGESDQQSAPLQRAFNATKWRRGVEELFSQLVELEAASDPLTFEKLQWVAGCVCEMLSKAASAPSTEISAIASQRFFSVAKAATRLFGRPEAQDAEYLPLLNQMLEAFKGVGMSQPRFHTLGVCMRDLQLVRTRLETKSAPAKKASSAASATTTMTSERSSPVDAMAVRFEALVSVADELLAMPVSERSDRVSNYVFSLVKELQACFFIKRRRTTPSRGALSAAADSVQKAVELVQGEPHASLSRTLFMQFLELLYAISSKYTSLKLLISRYARIMWKKHTIDGVSLLQLLVYCVGAEMISICICIRIRIRPRRRTPRKRSQRSP
jgi:hypothetical protein